MYRLLISTEANTKPNIVTLENMTDILNVVKKSVEDIGANQIRTIHIYKLPELGEVEIWPRFNSRV